MTPMLKILVVDDEAEHTSSVAEHFRLSGEEVFGCPAHVRPTGRAREARALLAREAATGHPYDLAVVDLGLPSGTEGGLAVMAAASELSPETKIVVRSKLNEDANRLFYGFAAVHWYPSTVLAIVSKSDENKDEIGNSRDFVRMTFEAIQGRIPKEDRSQPLRHGVAAEMFLKHFGNPRSFSSYQYLLVISRFDDWQKMADAIKADKKALRTRAGGFLEDMVALVGGSLDESDTFDAAYTHKQIHDMCYAESPIRAKEALRTLVNTQMKFFRDPSVAHHFGIDLDSCRPADRKYS